MMKIFVAVLLIFSASFAVSAQDGEQRIVWEKDYKKALASARETGKPLVLDFTAVWCKPCKMMDEKFWVLADVVEAMKPFIAVKVDYDNEKGLVDKYGVKAIPFVAFTDPLGNMITFRRGFGSKNARELNQIFDDMPKNFLALKELYDAIELKKDNGLALLQIADSYHASKMYGLSNEFYKKALKTTEIKNDVEKKERVSITLGVNYFTIRDYEQAISYLEDYLKDFPTGKSRDLALTVLAISNANRGKLKDANKYFELLKAEFPASKAIEAVTKAIEDARNKPAQ